MGNTCKSKFNIAEHRVSLPVRTAAEASRVEQQEQLSPSGKGGQVFLVEVTEPLPKKLGIFLERGWCVCTHTRIQGPECTHMTREVNMYLLKC